MREQRPGPAGPKLNACPGLKLAKGLAGVTLPEKGQRGPEASLNSMAGPLNVHLKL